MLCHIYRTTSDCYLVSGSPFVDSLRGGNDGNIAPGLYLPIQAPACDNLISSATNTTGIGPNLSLSEYMSSGVILTTKYITFKLLPHHCDASVLLYTSAGTVKMIGTLLREIAFIATAYYVPYFLRR